MVARPEAFSQAIATPAEHVGRRWTTAPELISLWSSKETLSKALGDALDYDPGARRLLRMGVLARAFPEVIAPLPDRHT